MDRAINAKAGTTEQLESSVKQMKDTYDIAVAKLKALAASHCRKCYGRGYTGFNISTGLLMPCRCAAKNHIKQEKSNGTAEATTAQ